MQRMMVLAAVSAVAGGLLAAGPAMAGSAGVPRTTAGGCEAGGTPAPLAGVTTLADGGKVYRYRIAGEINEVPVPPAGFNPLTAGAKALSTYGLPARPAATTAKAQWTARMRAFRRPSDPRLCVTAYRTRRASVTAGNSTNWAGYAAHHSSSRSYYVGATGDFVQTHAKTSCSGATWTGWVGLGGYYSGGGLIQAGSYRGSGGGVHAFYEYLDGSGGGVPVINMPSVKVKNGHHIHASVIYQRSTHRTTFYVYDTTNGTYQTVKKTLATKYYDGRTAEQIDERLTVGGGVSHLYHFGTDPWTRARAMRSADGAWHSLGSQAHTKITMVNGSGQTLAVPGGVSGQHFKDYWKRCK